MFVPFFLSKQNYIFHYHDVYDKSTNPLALTSVKLFLLITMILQNEKKKT